MKNFEFLYNYLLDVNHALRPSRSLFCNCIEKVQHKTSLSSRKFNTTEIFEIFNY